MRIVASTTSMLEEPYWRIEEPNPWMAEKSEAKKGGKEPQWGYITELASMRLLTEAASLCLPH